MTQIRLHLLGVVVAASVLPVAALADISGTVTLNVGEGVKLDTGATTTSGDGDLAFTGNSITFQGSAKGGVLPGATGAAVFSSITEAFLQSLAAFASSAPIPASMLPVGAILGVGTNGGNPAKVLVTATSSTSIGLQFTTYGVSGGGTSNGPTVTAVTNNYSFIPKGFPNSGISASSIFTIFGNNMAAALKGAVTLESSAGPMGLPTVLNGTSVSVTVGSSTVKPAFYYATPKQIAAVLPANTPTGSGTLTVIYNGASSAAFPIQVVPAALGLDTYYGTGTGLLTATDATTGVLVNYTNSASPGQNIVLWGTGLGADPQDSDTVFTKTPHAVSQSKVKVYFGGVQGTLLYAGSSGYPGLNQYNVTVPSGITGCYVSIVLTEEVSANSTLNVSNFGTLPIGQAGGDCEDSIFGVSGSSIAARSGKSTVKSSSLLVGQAIMPDSNGAPQTNNFASASFTSATGAAYGASSGLISLGSCIVQQIVKGGGSSGTSNGLDAGSSIFLKGPAGNYTLMASPLGKGFYNNTLPADAISSNGGAFMFSGTGGTDVGAFSANVNLPNPLLMWTDQSSAATINRAKGFDVTWSGGAIGSYVVISGSSSGAGGVTGNYLCYAPQSALKFSVPPYVTSTLPSGTGNTTVTNMTNPAQFSAARLDDGFGFGFNSTQVNSTYQ